MGGGHPQVVRQLEQRCGGRAAKGSTGPQRCASWWGSLHRQGRLQRLTAVKSADATTLQDLRYATTSTGAVGYDAVGNLLRIEDWKAFDFWGNPQVQTFAYDERDRLTSAGASGGDGQGSYSEVDAYDPVTGRVSRNAGLDYSYEAGHPHAVRRVTGSGGSARPVTIRARGTSAFNAWPIMKLYVNGQERATWTVSSSDYATYTLTTPLSGHDQLEVVFTNDAWERWDKDRNLYIDFVLVDGRQVEAEDGAALIDRALSGGTAFDGQDLLPGGEGLYWTSALRFVVGADAFAGGYDATGTLTSRLVDGAAQLLRYDAEQRLVEVQTGTGARLASFVYDADGRRVQATVNGVTTAYPGAHFEYEVGSGTTRKYYSAGGQRVAMRENGTLYWLLSDHLGSTTLTAAADGSKSGELRYRAWGETRSAAGSTPTSYRYTGQRQEAALGLYYYGARWYDPALGRFLQPDTIVPEPGNPLAYDRYAYALNNPLRYTDPAGHWTEEQLAAALGEDWRELYFGEGGVFEGRQRLLEFLLSDKTTNGLILNEVVADLFVGAAAAHAAGVDFDAVDAIGFRVTGGFASIPGSVQGSAEALLNLTSGELSLFLSTGGGLGIGETGEFGAGYFLVKNLSKNEDFRGVFWQMGAIGGPGLGLKGDYFFGPLDDSYDPSRTVNGAAVGVGGPVISLMALTVSESMYYEAFRYDGDGPHLFRPGDPFSASDAMLRAFIHDVILNPVWLRLRGQ